MAGFHAASRPDARLIADARRCLPTDDAEAHRSIVALLAMTAQAGVDPIAALGDAMHRWFGAAGADLLPPASVAEPEVQPAPGMVTLEPLPPLRRPKLWPQRPKRLADELFSSWLWRTSVAAGAPPDRFAADVFGTCPVDPDAEISEATLRRLALLSGQSAFRLAAGTLTAAQPITRADTVLDALRQHGGFLLNAASCAAQPPPLLQYCPRCLARDPRPYFRRGWRFATEALCLRHRCRLHDACWHCGAALDLLGQRIASRQPLCARCGAMLAQASAAPVTDAVRGQRGLTCVLYYAAVCLEPEALAAHLETLACRFPARLRVAERELALAGFLPSNLDHWFGPVTDPHHRDLMQQHAAGKTYGAWFGSAAIPDAPPLRQTRPLSRRRKSRSPWFAPAAPPSHQAQSTGTGEDRCCPPSA